MDPKKASGKVEGRKGHVRMTIEEKQEIIRKHENGTRVVEIARQHKKAMSTICTVIAKKKEIMSAKVAKGVSTITKQRTQTLEDVEKLLLTWIHSKELAGDSVSEAIICEKARKLHEDLVKKTPGTSDANMKEFKASRGWFDNFKKRSGIHSVSRHGEGASSDKPAAERFVGEFKYFVESEGYLPQQVFNCDETGLFWKRLPKRTYITQEEKSLPGHKPMKDRLTLVLCSNASGDLKIKPLLVYHSETPRAFKKYNVQKNQMCVMWRANSKAWVTRLIFTEWVNEVVCPSIQKYLQEKGLPLKAVLLLDNAPAHPPSLEDELLDRFSFVTIKFLPPNTTPLIQPMDQKIIANFKKLYERALFRKCFEVTDCTNLTLKEFWKDHFNICIALKLIDKAWQEVTQRTLISGWRKLWPECVSELDFEGFEAEPEVPIVQEIVSLGQQLGLELDGADVEELVEEHNEELTTDELQALYKEQQQEAAEEWSSGEEEPAQNVPSSTIKKWCGLWEEMQTFIEMTHPEKAVVGRCINLFNDTVMPHYRKVLQRREKQASMDRFVVRKTSSEPQAGPSGLQAKRARECTPPKSSVPEVIMEGDSPSKH